MASRPAGMHLDFGDQSVIELSVEESWYFLHSVGRLARGKLGGTWETTGTAFGIARLTDTVLYVSARHCVEWAVDDPNSYYIAVSVPTIATEGESPQHPAPVLEVAVSMHSDAALLQVSTASPDGRALGDLFGWKLDLAQPKIGDECVALGWIEKNGVPTMIGSKGNIIEFYDAGVAPSYRNYPTIVLDARTFSGMSGGPVVTRDGAVLGLITSSMDTFEDSQATTFVSHISALAELTTTVEDQGRTVEVGLQTLINSGMQVANPRNAFMFSVDDATAAVTWIEWSNEID